MSYSGYDIEDALVVNKVCEKYTTDFTWGVANMDVSL